MNLADWIVVDREILGGEPVLTGTRVPVTALFDYLERGYTLDEFGVFSIGLGRFGWESMGVCGVLRGGSGREVFVQECGMWAIGDGGYVG